ncbi:peptidoglycan DD-metalloendopeptidase family protein [Streptomyces sp. NPDC058257]|uniref:peptidoglycan DD-metalloendopeptidase family protein n=1 Tax=Streptomyces sp. NPDC058257 TaxID=3346409 RepID=UPI0036E8BABB
MRRSLGLVLLTVALITAELITTALITTALITTAASPAAAADSVAGSAREPVREPVPKVGGAWPVGVRPSVVRGWEPPATEYGRGHRGVDLAAAPGAVVRAVAPGRVSFAGRVAGRGVIAVELAGTGDPPLRTTYGPVRATVKKGAKVATGEALGVLELPTGPTTPPGPMGPTPAAHCPSSCLHWGLLRADAYLNPLSLLPPWLLGRGASRLLPVIDVPLLRLLPWWPGAPGTGVPGDGGGVPEGGAG